MTALSHIPGGPSSEESKWLSKITGVNEGVLRKAAHVVCFAVLAGLVVVGFTIIPLWLRIAAVSVWSFLDEWSKALPCFQGRHYCFNEFLLNLLGVGIGSAIGIVVILTSA